MSSGPLTGPVRGPLRGRLRWPSSPAHTPLPSSASGRDAPSSQSPPSIAQYPQDATGGTHLLHLFKPMLIQSPTRSLHRRLIHFALPSLLRRVRLSCGRHTYSSSLHVVRASPHSYAHWQWGRLTECVRGATQTLCPPPPLPHLHSPRILHSRLRNCPLHVSIVQQNCATFLSGGVFFHIQPASAVA